MGPFLPDAVRAHARRAPGAPAVSEGGRTLGYGALDTRSNRLAQALLAEGLTPGQRVGYLARPGILGAEVLLACAKAGLVATPLNWRLAARELTRIAADAELALMITQSEFLGPARSVAETRPGTPLVIDGDGDGEAGAYAYETWLSGAADEDPGRGSENAVYLQLYTSGTTGLPKGVQLTLENTIAGPAQLAEMEWRPEAIALNAMPVFHIAGTGWLIQALNAGARTVTMPDFRPTDAVELMERERITHAFFAPSILHMLTTVPGIEDRDFSALETIVYGSSPITPALLRRSMKIFGCAFYQKYGQTENVGSSTRLLSEDHDPDGPRAHLLRSAGLPFPYVDLRITDPVTGEPLPRGEVGEILVRSHQVMPGYWNRPEENAKTLTEDGFLRTGDAGCLDAEGYLFITDRIKDMVITGGENVYPIEVESVLAEHPAVLDVAVYGTPHATWGEAVTAAVVLRADADPVTEAELIAFAKERIASYKKPRTVHFMDELPRNPSGKILKRVLRDTTGGGESSA
ncbi:long-chain-fatty-acid--CoA ligase [Streptomyces sp. NPDC059783]|uniref:long-chain-fatty-acid--CoA ligase n=1 Tax=Streptomyces sp. NPDC059783 TaxID=3346944 RepID=UPI00365813FF